LIYLGIQTILNINVAKFNEKFKEAVIKFFYDKELQKNFLESTKKLLSKHLKNLSEPKFHEVLLQIEKEDLHNFTKVINLSIEDTYKSLTSQDCELTQEKLATLRQKVWDLQAIREIRGKLIFSVLYDTMHAFVKVVSQGFQ
jgi:hypothetical protein